MQNKKVFMIYLAGILLLALAMFLSVAYGVKSVSLSDVIRAFTEKAPIDYNVNVVQARIPRTIFGLLAGASLSISGVLMQSITRNPVADPSILGVNTGASLFIVAGISFFHIQSKLSYIGVAFLGALLAALLVYRLASLGYGGPTPIKLAISGAAVSTALSSLVSLIVMPDSSVMTTFRFWQIGSVGGVDTSDILWVLPILACCVVCSLFLSGQLNALQLSEETATALGVNVNRVKALAAVCGVFLCATITALAGPISFVGLMVPHIIRMILGSDHVNLICAGAIYGGVILILADVVGRILGAPGELETGIMTAMMGGPIFVFIVRKARVQSL